MQQPLLQHTIMITQYPRITLIFLSHCFDWRHTWLFFKLKLNMNDKILSFSIYFNFYVWCLNIIKNLKCNKSVFLHENICYRIFRHNKRRTEPRFNTERISLISVIYILLSMVLILHLTNFNITRLCSKFPLIFFDTARNKLTVL